jgi:hypothetical protein
MKIELTDFWNVRRQNKDSAEPSADLEIHIDTSTLKGDVTEVSAELLFDIKEQLCELNYSIGTIGEMFGSYLEALNKAEEE